jgi:hypothetical protein
MKMHTKFVRNVKGKYHFGDLDVDGRIILKRILKETLLSTHS